MIRVFFAIITLFVLVAIGGMVLLGAFPPGPRTEQVQRVIPNDKFH